MINSILDFSKTILDHLQSDVFIRLSLAALVGILIGIEREVKRKPVGIKTLTVVAISSALLTVVSIKSVEHYALISDNINMDPMRLAAQIVSGVGFLGAGLIMKKNNNAVSGLTTAAIVWGVSAIGITIGAGFIEEALFAVVFFLLGVEIIPTIVRKYTHFDINRKLITLSLTLPKDYETKTLLRDLKEEDVLIKSVRIRDESGKKNIAIRGYVSENKHVTDIYDVLSQKAGIEQIEITE